MPLGGNVVRKDLGEEMMQDITRYTKMSIEYTINNPDEAFRICQRNGDGIDDDTTRNLSRCMSMIEQ